jgi:hypothetical protein
MTNISDLENDLLERLTKENPARRITRVEGSRWGRLILPAPDEADKRPGCGLRVLCIGSWTLGLLAFETLLSLETRKPGEINLVGLVTDDPLDVDAKISVKKRFWHYYEEPEREEYEWVILHHALPVGIPCYTGEIKSSAFRNILSKWAPEAIVVAAFGQVIDEAIIGFPAYGIYNIHPSDLLHCHGAGPQPWEDLVERKAFSTRVTLHRVSPTIDDGDIVGQSPEINVRLPDGGVSNDVRMIGEKALVPVGPMVRELALALVNKKASGLKGPLDSLDFERIFGSAFKAKLMEPLDPVKRGHILPLPDGEEQYTV